MMNATQRLAYLFYCISITFILMAHIKSIFSGRETKDYLAICALSLGSIAWGVLGILAFLLVSN